MTQLRRRQVTGHIIYVLGWPFWMVYFRLYWQRSRVLLVCGKEVLLVQGIINKAGNWSLPGGGVDKGETAVEAAVRELMEEVSVSISQDKLHYLGAERVRSGPGIHYTAEYFTAMVPEKPEITIKPDEILLAAWVPMDKVFGYHLQEDAETGLRLLLKHTTKV